MHMVVYERDKLYDEVSAEPVITVAECYGVFYPGSRPDGMTCSGAEWASGDSTARIACTRERGCLWRRHDLVGEGSDHAT